MKQRSGKDVQNKVTAIEAQMRLAQDFSESSTGQGLQDGSILGSWDEAVKQKCKYWFLLQPVFGQRAGMKPMVTTEDMLKSLDDDDSDVSTVDFGNDNGGGFTLLYQRFYEYRAFQRSILLPWPSQDPHVVCQKVHRASYQVKQNKGMTKKLNRASENL